LDSLANCSLDASLESGGFVEIFTQQSKGLVCCPFDFEHSGNTGNYLYFLFQQKKGNTKSAMRQATLCLLVRENPAPGGDKEILLAMKKRGFGAGKWNGVGGKIDPNQGDGSIVDTATRETKEEIGVTIKNLDRVAILNFRFPYKEEWNQDVHVFLVKDWEGEPIESEEMKPKWFKTNELPYDEMWDDDKFWLPGVLRDKKLKANFVFKQGEIIDKHNIKFINNF
jgi:8-oxo-dGTP pyrophosphatase MutT (NUDIX family)